MKDGIINGTGNSRYLKTVSDALTKYPTYESFLTGLIEGTFPIDFNGINAAGWTQQGTQLNKANLLTDETAAAIGLSDDATPNQAFAKAHELIKEAQNSAITAENNNAFVHLTGPFTRTASEADFNIDLSKLGIENYRALKVYAAAAGSGASITAGGLTVIIGGMASENSGVEIDLLNTGAVFTMMTRRVSYNSYTKAYLMSENGLYGTNNWNSMDKITTVNATFIDIYGIKA